MLREWAQKNGKSLAQFGREIGLTKQYVSALDKDASRLPSLPVAFAIEDATGGEVTARSWLSRKPQPREEPSS